MRGRDPWHRGNSAFSTLKGLLRVPHPLSPFECVPLWKGKTIANFFHSASPLWKGKTIANFFTGLLRGFERPNAPKTQIHTKSKNITHTHTKPPKLPQNKNKDTGLSLADENPSASSTGSIGSASSTSGASNASSASSTSSTSTTSSLTSTRTLVLL